VPDHWIELRAEPDPVDFEDLGVDIRITYGKHLYPHHDTRPLFSDTWRREMTMLPPSYIPRWIDVQVHGEDTPRKAFAFTANPESPNYAGELTPDEVAACLSEACGHWGSGAEYLLQTVTSLEAAGFHDPYL
jgi:cation transport protein ChaC